MNDFNSTGHRDLQRIRELEAKVAALKQEKETMHQNMLTVVAAGVGVKQQLEKAEAENAKLREEAQAVVDDCHIPMNRMPPATDSYGINGRKLYALKTALEKNDGGVEEQFQAGLRDVERNLREGR